MSKAKAERFAVRAPTLQRRYAAIDASAIDEKNRTIRISFSSETREVLREDEQFGRAVPEILLHTPEAVDLEPVRNIGSLLKNHDPNQIIGYPLSVDLDGKRGVAVVKFGATPIAEAAWQEVRQKMLKGVSFGYEIIEAYRVHEGETTEDGIAGPAVVASRWRVLELTLTPIPADTSVGVGRSKPAKAAATRKEAKMSKKNAARTGKRCGDERGAVSIHIEKDDLAQDVASTDYTEEHDREVTDSDVAEEEVEKQVSGRKQIVNGAEDDEMEDVDEEEEPSPTGGPRSGSPRTRVNAIELQRSARHAERARITGIRKAVHNAGLDDDFGNDMIERGVSLSRTCELIVKRLGERDSGAISRGSRSGGNDVRVTADGNEKRLRHMTVNLSRSLGRRADEKGNLDTYIDETPEEKKIERQTISLMRLGEEYLRMVNYPGAQSMTREQIARTMFSHDLKMRAAAGNVSGSIANVLANIQNKALVKAYAKAQPTWRRWCKVGTTPDFKQAYRLRLADFADLRQTDENGEILDSQTNDEKEALTLAVYARRISLTWQMFVNDDLDALGSLPAKMGQAAARLPSRLVYTHLLANPTMGDGSALFVAGHSNLDNTVTAFGAVTLKTAITDMRKQKSIQAANDTEFTAEPLDVNPAILLVPPELEIAAKQIAFSPGDVTANINANVINVYRDIIREVVVESRLSTTGYTGQSATAWYLIGDPASLDTCEVTFLDGNEMPRTDTYEDFDRLAMQFRAYLPCTAKMLDWRGIHKSVGA